ncbi:aminopeptidase N-like [Haliotis cracherodii]|uniref:aminopeptidase N-like n=1 Tax=Haliotis cracherodii TaxID=6455 RepID=UPI0039E8A519
MSPKYSMNGDTFPTFEGGDGGSKGCRVSIVTGFILLLLSLAISVGVGIIVHFAGSRDVVCQCGGVGVTPAPVTPSPEALRAMCISIIQDGEGDEICAACSESHSNTTASTSTSTSMPTPTTAPSNYRLPITVLPYLYSVELQPNIYGTNDSLFDFNGSVAIHTVAQSASNSIVLHAHPTLMIDTASVVVLNVNTTAGIAVKMAYEELRHFVTLHLDEAMEVGHHYRISMTFTGPLTQDGTGLYLSFYEDNNNKIYLATTQFQAPNARKAFPCFDEPGLKAEFDIALVVKDDTGRNYTSLSNNKVKATELTGVPGMVKHIYERTVTMPTYLLAFIVCDYEYVENLASNVTYRTWAMPQRLEFTATAQEHGVRIFNRYAEYFTPAYVYDKLDNIAIPDFNAGAMENWGLITYRETLLYEPGVSSASDEDWIGVVVSHEVAHMWFGDLVSPKWWNWLWLNEGFASFWDYHIVGELNPTWRSLDLFVAGDMHGVMEADALRSSHPLTTDVMSPGEISASFDSVTYSKGSSIVRLMYLAMGQELFIKGLNRYLATHAYGNTEHQDLWDALTEEASANSVALNMTEIMDPWATQMNYPVVNVTVETGKITLTQQRFLVSGAENASQDTGTYGYKWTIPITYTSSVDPQFDTVYTHHNLHYMKYHEDSLVVDLNETLPADGWVIVNIKECGYFRVNYDVNTWNNIINFLSNGSHELIHPINRAQIINDAWNLAKAGLLDQAIALRTVNYLSKDLDYVPWKAFIRELGYVESMLERTSLYGIFQVFMRNTVSTPFAQIGTNISETMAPIEKFTVSQMASLACRHDLPECVQVARQLFNQWMANPDINPIHPDLQSTVYCTAVRSGGHEDWEFTYAQLQVADSSSEQSRLREALACSREPGQLQRLLEMSLNPDEIRPQDTRTTITAVADSRWGRDLAWNFLKNRFSDLGAAVTSFSGMSRLVGDVTNKFNTEQDYKQIEDFVNSGDDLSQAGDAFVQAMDRTRANIRWLGDNYNIFEDWLTEQNANSRL